MCPPATQDARHAVVEPSAVSPLQLVQCCLCPVVSLRHVILHKVVSKEMAQSSLPRSDSKLSLSPLCTVRHRLCSYAALDLKENYMGFVFPEDPEPQLVENQGQP